MTKQEIQTEALGRALAGQSLTNYPAIFEGFTAKGIPEAKGSLPISGQFAPLTAGYSAEYIMDGLKHCGENCQFQYTAPNNAAQFVTPGFTYVVMPMRLS